MADIRGDTCNAGMREMSQKRKNVTEDPELSREVGERAKLKRETEEDDEQIHKGKTKKRKERAAKEERPLSHGAHDVARQDGAETKVEGGKCSSWPRHTPHPPTAPPSIFTFAKMTDHTQRLLQSPSTRRTPALMTVPPFHLHPCCPPTVPLPGQIARPRLGLPGRIPAKTPHQPEPQPAVPQVQIFGENPLKFDDPTVYHIRDVTPDMPDDEKKEIYSVARFPKSDLAHMMAGVPPDKDFSNAKPSNQVSANTFQGLHRAVCSSSYRRRHCLASGERRPCHAFHQPTPWEEILPSSLGGRGWNVLRLKSR